MTMKRLLLTVFLLVLAPYATGTEVNIAIYNYSSSRIAVYHNYRWLFTMEPQEYQGLTFPWDETETFDFFRYPEGSMSNAYRVQTYVTRFRPYEEIRIYDQNLP